MIAPTAPHHGHAIKLQPALTDCEHHLRVLELTVDVLIAQINKGDCWSEGFLDAETLLAALPFPTAEFALAIGRLRNALAYCRTKEFGAAAFELRALRRRLDRLYERSRQATGSEAEEQSLTRPALSFTQFSLAASAIS